MPRRCKLDGTRTNVQNSESCSENSREFPRGNPRKTLETPNFVWFFVGIRGKCCPFFSRTFFRRPSPFILQFFQSSIRLRFFLGEFLATNSEMGVRGFLGRIFGPLKNPCFASRKRRQKVLLFLGFFFGVLFLLRRVFPEGFAQRTP